MTPSSFPASDLPPDLPGHLHKSARAGMMRIHSQMLEGQDETTCLREAYDVLAGAWSKAEEPLTEVLLEESIPAGVFRWAVAHSWWRYPPRRLRKTPQSRQDVIPRVLKGKFVDVSEPVPDIELTVEFGGRRITESYKRSFMSILAGRIAFWKAKLLEEATAAGRPESPQTVHKKRSRPQTIPEERKLDAAKLKKKGGTNKQVAAIIYDTKHPTDQQKKNVAAILRNHERKSKTVNSPAKRSEASPSINKTEG